jgi:GT2 family glycosyltransferase/predicted SAM-dependent methyltransferase
MTSAKGNRRIIIGSGGLAREAWESTDMEALDVLCPSDWKRMFGGAPSIANVLSEHMFEHLTEWQCFFAFLLIRRHLTANGRLRIAVPDGYRRDPAYVAETHPPKDGHKTLFNKDSLTHLLRLAGYRTEALEYFTAEGEFVQKPWSPDDGYIARSKPFDAQEAFALGDLRYTSLIVDAFPEEARAGEPLAGRGPEPPGDRVFVVIPVFNRRLTTLICLEQLRLQTYRPMTVIVADGGSTDGTREEIASRFPQTVVLTPEKGEWWWGHAVAAGIDHAMKNRTGPGDMALILNDDTVFPFDFVETLARVSRRENAAVKPVACSSRAPDAVILAGEYLVWRGRNIFRHTSALREGAVFQDDADTASGYGCLVPLAMVERAGNVDAAAFPHYLADYEFFHRIKKSGFRLGVTLETKTLVQPNEKPRTEGLTKHYSIRSQDNFFIMRRFIKRHAPPEKKGHILRRFYLSSMKEVVISLLGMVGLGSAAGKILDLAFSSNPIPAGIFEMEGLDMDTLVSRGVIEPIPSAEGFVRLNNNIKWPDGLEGKLEKISGQARGPLFKLRFLPLYLKKRYRFRQLEKTKGQ